MDLKVFWIVFGSVSITPKRMCRCSLWKYVGDVKLEVVVKYAPVQASKYLDMVD